MKVLAIAPYQGLKNVIEQIGAEEKDFDLHAVYGNLKEGLEAARAAADDGYEMILSRGGTAKLIKEQVSLPVIDIQVSGYDVLRVLTLAKGYSGRVAILGFPSIAHGAATICNLLEIDISVYTIYDEKEVEPKLNEIKRQGIDVIIGDVITVETARKLGLQEILITSGTESVREAFNDMKETHRFFQQLTQRQQLFKQTLDETKQGVFILNQKGQAVYANRAADALENGFLSQLSVQHFVRNIEDKARGVLEIGRLMYPVAGTRQRIDDRDYTALYVNLPSGDFGKEQGIEIIEPIPSPDPYPFARVTGVSGAIRRAVEKAKGCSRSDVPVWLSGEKGTGKEMFARLIHQGSSRNDRPMMQLDAAQIEPGRWGDILSNELPLSHFGTFYVQNFDQLPLAASHRLVQLFDDRSEDRARLIVSCEKGVNDLWADRQFSERLAEVLAEGHIHLPPLRERSEDMEDLARLFIAHFNSIYGKEIVGLQQEVFKELKSLSWPGNVAEFRQVIGRLVLESDGPYVGMGESAPVLAELREHVQGRQTGGLDLTGTLEDIEKRIIEKVLQEENMNQSRAAKRLGINRTTLWRKLK